MSLVATQGKVARLRKSLYGLKQAGKCCNDTLDSWLRAETWTADSTNPCLHTLRKEDGSVSLLLYLHVDNSDIAAASEKDINDFASKLDKTFPCTRQGDLHVDDSATAGDGLASKLDKTFPCTRQGDLKFFFGMEIFSDRKSRQLCITQHRYIERGSPRRYQYTEASSDISLGGGVGDNGTR